MRLSKGQKRRKKEHYFMAGKSLEATTLKRWMKIEIEHGRHQFISKRVSMKPLFVMVLCNLYLCKINPYQEAILICIGVTHGHYE